MENVKIGVGVIYITNPKNDSKEVGMHDEPQEFPAIVVRGDGEKLNLTVFVDNEGVDSAYKFGSGTISRKGVPHFTNADPHLGSWRGAEEVIVIASEDEELTDIWEFLEARGIIKDGKSVLIDEAKELMEDYKEKLQKATKLYEWPSPLKEYPSIEDLDKILEIAAQIRLEIEKVQDLDKDATMAEMSKIQHELNIKKLDELHKKLFDEATALGLPQRKKQYTMSELEAFIKKVNTPKTT